MLRVKISPKDNVSQSIFCHNFGRWSFNFCLNTCSERGLILRGRFNLGLLISRTRTYVCAIQGVEAACTKFSARRHWWLWDALRAVTGKQLRPKSQSDTTAFKVPLLGEWKLCVRMLMDVCIEKKKLDMRTLKGVLLREPNYNYSTE